LAAWSHRLALAIALGAPVFFVPPPDIAGSREIDSIAKGQPENAEDDVHEEANPGFYTAATGSHSEIEADGG